MTLVDLSFEFITLWETFSSFPTMFSTMSKKDYAICANSELSSAHAFNMDKATDLSSGKGSDISCR